MARAGGVSLRRGFALRCRRARRSVAGNRRLRRPYVSKERKTPAVLGLDMGGTHTDAVLLRGGTLLASVKVPTNHQDLLVSTREALHALFESGAAFPADVRDHPSRECRGAERLRACGAADRRGAGP